VDRSAADRRAEAALVAPGRKRPPLTRAERARVHRAVNQAEKATGLDFSVCLCHPTDEQPHVRAERMFAEHGLHTKPSVLIAVVPESRRVEIRTSGQANERGVDDERCQAAIDRMLAVFATGDLAGGIVAGVESLAAASAG
jgi:uncharacterized membrane protein YgcG